jgi:uncharacterized membrane protein YciS (DUF1049 family)
MKFLKYFIQMILFILAVMFFIENSEAFSQKIQFHFDLFIPEAVWQLPELPIFFFTFIVFAAGIVLTMLCFVWGRWHMGFDLHKANAKIRKLEKEITAYRQRALNTEDAPVPAPAASAVSEKTESLSLPEQ